MADQINQRIYLLENANATGEYKSYERDRGNSKQTPDCQLHAFGTFDGATLTFTFRPFKSTEDLLIYNGTIPLEITETSRKQFAIEIPDGEQIKAIISGAGAGTLLTVYLTELRVK